MPKMQVFFPLSCDFLPHSASAWNCAFGKILRLIAVFFHSSLVGIADSNLND